MGLRDFFKAKRLKKFAKVQAADTALPDEEISKNWVTCKKCKTTVHISTYKENLNVCPECNSYGRLSLQERINLLADVGSYEEYFADLTPADPLSFNDGKPYPETITKAQKKTGAKEALATGFITIKGIKVAIAAMNFDFIGGSMGSVVGEKFTQMCEKALKAKVPFICISASGGARMHEGILSLMQMAKTSIALARLSEASLPFVSILTDPTYGGVSASYANLGDIAIAEPGARIGFAGRRVIEETVREKLPADFQTAEYLLEHGQLDLIVERKDMKSKVAQVLALHGFSSEELESQTNISMPIINKPNKKVALDFEKPLLNIQDEIQTLERKVSNNEDQTALNTLKKQYREVEAQIYKNLSPIEVTRVARHPHRPQIHDYLNILAPNAWVELHGDRAGTDDEAIMAAIVKIDGQNCMAIGTRKGRSIKENQARNFGMPQPEGYRKAKRFFEHANKFGMPIITFIDTPGAYPGLNAEANGQSIAIAENLKSLANVEVPVVAVITGEGGSGGALAIGVANKVLMLENSVYSVISPEGCAAILWRTRDKAPEAAEALKITAPNLKELGVVDEVITEPLGGAHKEWVEAAHKLQESVLESLNELKKLNGDKLKEHRMNKFYALGKFEGSLAAGRTN